MRRGALRLRSARGTELHREQSRNDVRDGGGGLPDRPGPDGKGTLTSRILKSIGGIRGASLAWLAGLGSTGATLAGSVATAGLGTIAATVGAGALIGGGLGWGANKGIDAMFGEKGGLGNWLYDVINPPERAIDIDTEIDFMIAKEMARRLKKSNKK